MLKFKRGDKIKVIRLDDCDKYQGAQISDEGVIDGEYRFNEENERYVLVRLDRFHKQKDIETHFYESPLEKIIEESKNNNKPKKKYAWKFRGDTNTISVEDSIEDCIKEARGYYYDYKIREIEVGEYTTYVPEFDDTIGETIKEMSSCYFDEDDMDQWLEDEEKNKKLAKELNKTLNKFLIENNEVPNFGNIKNIIYITIEGNKGSWKE